MKPYLHEHSVPPTAYAETISLDRYSLATHRPLFQILPGELSFPFRLELVEKRLGIMVIHKLKPLARVERLEGLEDQGMAFARRNLAHVDGCFDNSELFDKPHAFHPGCAAAPRRADIVRAAADRPVPLSPNALRAQLQVAKSGVQAAPALLHAHQMRHGRALHQPLRCGGHNPQ